MSHRPGGPLRRGWTTGACAAAAARAAAEALLSGRFPDPVAIRLPRGERPRFALALKELHAAAARVGVIKDAGDDPDVTHGAMVIAEVARGAPGSGIVFCAGEGVGRVTRPGLMLAVGEPAINPAPRAMIVQALAEAAETCDAALVDAVVTVSIPGGEALAARTLNARLGIVGGLSILGTTGVVVPYSCSAWIHSIHRGIDVARAAGLTHVAASTGSTSEAAVRRLYDLPEPALIDMGDFAGATLKYLRRHPVPRLTIAGGFGKVAKLAQGHLDLHSSSGRIDTGKLATMLRELGGEADVRDAQAAGEILAAAGDKGRALVQRIAAEARAVALATLAGGTAVDVAVFGRDGGLIGHAGA